MYKYSKKTNSFYDLSLSYPKLPDDLTDVIESDFQKILKAREENRNIEFVDGILCISDPCPGAFYEWNSNLKKWIPNLTKQNEYKNLVNKSQKNTLLLQAKEQINVLQDELELGLSDHP